MGFWNGFGSVLTGGISNLFTSKNANGAASFLNDPLGYGARDEAAALNREQFEFQKDSWQNEFNLQNQQFDYQKWYDQNNVTLGLKQNMDAGINPLAAQGGGNSSVTASASPQNPSVTPNGSVNGSVLGDILSQLGQNKRAELSADVAAREMSTKKQIADDELAQQKDFQQKYLNILNKKVQNESTRTSAYASEAGARTQNLVQEFETALADKYGRGSTKFKKLLGEFRTFAKELADGDGSSSPTPSDGMSADKYGRVSSSDSPYFQEYQNYRASVHKNPLSYEDWLFEHHRDAYDSLYKWW